METTENDTSQNSEPKEMTFKERYKTYIRFMEYSGVVVFLFILAIAFWHMMAFLMQAIKKVEKISKS